MNITMRPIGTMKSVFHYKNGTPRQSSLCENARGILTIEKTVFNNPEHSLEGLEQYSHAWIIFIFHKNNNPHKKAKVKPPRLDGQRVGVFSSRSPYRPNNIGLSLVQIDKIEGPSVHFSGIDILDGTPVLDIKPYIPDYDRPKQHISEPLYGSSEVSHVSCTCRTNNDAGKQLAVCDSEKHKNLCRCKNESNSNSVKSECDFHFAGCPEIRDPNSLDKTSSPSLENSDMTSERVFEDVHNQKQQFESVGGLEIDHDQHPVAEGFYVLSAALEKAGQKLSSAKSVSAFTGDYQTPDVLAQSPAVMEDLLLPSDSGGDDDVDMLIGNILNKAAFDISSETVLDSASSHITSLQKEPQSFSQTPSKPAFHSSASKENSEKDKTTKQNGPSQVAGSNTKDSSSKQPVVAQWLSEPPVSKLHVTFTKEASTQLQNFSKHAVDPTFQLQMLTNVEDAEKAIRAILHEEPRSVYRRQHCQDSLYYFAVDVLHVTCWFDGDTAQVVRVKPVALVPKLQQINGPYS